jgi:hypothetical protein
MEEMGTDILEHMIERDKKQIQYLKKPIEKI